MPELDSNQHLHGSEPQRLSQSSIRQWRVMNQSSTTQIQSGCPSRTRTYNPTVNSRWLCQLSYRASLLIRAWERQDSNPPLQGFNPTLSHLSYVPRRREWELNPQWRNVHDCLANSLPCQWQPLQNRVSTNGRSGRICTCNAAASKRRFYRPLPTLSRRADPRVGSADGTQTR